MDYVKKVINKGWKFCLKDEKEAFQKDFPDDKWENVTLPHDWSVRYPMSREYSSGTGYVRGGTGWYRKHFFLPEDWKGKKLFLRFDGVYKNSQVWVNGYYMGKRPYGYITFQYDISDFACFGEQENIISVKVAHEDIADSRWFTGSGITRKVSLLVYDAAYPVENGIFFYCENVSENSAKVVVSNELGLAAASKVIVSNKLCSAVASQVGVSNKSASALDTFISNKSGSTAAPNTTISNKPGSADSSNVLICNKLYDAEGQLVLSMESTANFDGSSEKTIVNTGVLESPCLWSTKRPYLYTLETSVTNPATGENSVIDRQKVGIRGIAFDANNGFFLNGKPEIFKGVCVHHDGGCLGAAMTKGVWRRRLKKLKAMGCNAIRMSHNPHMPELYELCDEMGFLVMDEAFDEWEAPKNKWHIGHNVYPPKHEGYAEDFPQWHEQDLTALIRRDRNHPSIVMWSIGNEIDYPNDPYCHPLFSSMTGNNDKNKPSSERRYNPSRPNAERLPVIASRLVKIVKKSDTTRPVTAAVAFPELSTRIGYVDDLDVIGYNYKEHLYAEDHRRFPDKPLLGSENNHSYAAWKAVTDNDYISGQFLWTGIDYLGECRGWPLHGSSAGLITTAGFEKTGYYKRKSWWSDEAVVHIVTARKDTGNVVRSSEWKEMFESWNYVPGEEIEVRCYTNQPDVKLYLNGIPCTRQVDTTSMGYLTWYVFYEPGILEAVSANASHRLETVNAPVKISLNPVILEDNGSDDMESDNILQIELFVLDDKDRVVISDHSKITVRLEGDGELLGLDNGDLSDVTDYTANYRTTREGKLMIYVRKTGSGILKVTAESPYLKSAVVEL